MCGAETKLFKAIIEDAEMSVCRDCAKFGRVIGEIREKPGKILRIEKEKPSAELIQIIVEDYAEKIKKAREKLGLKQKDLAKRLNEKESLIHKIETKTIEPNINLARKIEKFLKIKLIEQHEEVHQRGTETKSDSLTIGDFVKIKKR